MAKVRIQKELAAAGVASRRAVEQLIVEGRITVNRELVTKLPCFIDLAVDDVRVDGQAVKLKRAAAKRVYYLLNKPRGVVCTQNDPAGRTRAVDMLGGVKERVFCVGRLDAESTGLLLLTNDGELTELLTHPRYGVPKTYVVEIDGQLTADQIAKLTKGVYIDGKLTRGARVKSLRKGPKQSLLEITLTEGRNREIRRMLARIGHKVRKLKRVAIGPITNKGLKIGSYRQLNRTEITAMRRSVRRPADK